MLSAAWSSGMILVSGAGGRGFNSRSSPFFVVTKPWAITKFRTQIGSLNEVKTGNQILIENLKLSLVINQIFVSECIHWKSSTTDRSLAAKPITTLSVVNTTSTGLN